jgi:FkbM family methyltransferase
MPLLIEVGAYDGTDSLKFHAQGYRVFTFEPKKDLYEALINKTSGLLNYTVIPKAVCLQNGKTQFNICRVGGASSILPFRSDEELIKSWTEARSDVQYSGVSYEVETIRLDSFIEENNLQDTIIDYIHIDAQGVDLDVLKSMGKYIKNVKMGVVETVIYKEKSIYIGQENTLEHVEAFLDQNNFTISRIESNDAEQCEYNVFFEKKF